MVAMEMDELVAADSKEEEVDVETAGEAEASGSGCTATACFAALLAVGEPPLHKDREWPSSPAVGEGEEHE